MARAYTHCVCAIHARAGPFVALKAALLAWKIGASGFVPSSEIQLSKKNKVSYRLSRKDPISWGASVTER